MHHLILNGKLHIKKYHHLRKIHSDCLDSMINYFKNDKYNLNGEIGKLLDENKKLKCKSKCNFE